MTLGVRKKYPSKHDMFTEKESKGWILYFYKAEK